MAGRCGDLYRQIDGLGEARTVADLVARLTPILNELAYAAAMGDGAVLDAREEWHTTYGARLRAEHAAAQAAAPPAATPAPSRRAPPGKPRAPARAEHLPASLRAIMDGTHASFADDADP